MEAIGFYLLFTRCQCIDGWMDINFTHTHTHTTFLLTGVQVWVVFLLVGRGTVLGLSCFDRSLFGSCSPPPKPLFVKTYISTCA